MSGVSGPRRHARPPKALEGAVTVSAAATWEASEDSGRVGDRHLPRRPSAGSGCGQGGQREPYEWARATVRTLRQVDTRALLHPLDHTLWTAWGWLGGLAQQCPTAAQGPRLVPVGEEAVMPETHEAAG